MNWNRGQVKILRVKTKGVTRRMGTCSSHVGALNLIARTEWALSTAGINSQMPELGLALSNLRHEPNITQR